MFNCGIYRIRNLVNNKCLYGSSKNIQERWLSHIRKLRNGKHENIFLQRSFSKYGEDNFIFELVEECIRDDLLIIEQVYIDNSDGYNIASANGGDMLTSHPNREEIIEKRKATAKKNVEKMTVEERKEKWGRPGEENYNWRNGGITKKKCPLCELVWIHSTCNSCSNCRDRTGESNPFYGKQHTDKTKQLLREENTGKKHTQATKDKLSGENAARFMGYYHTPWGIFPSSSQAQNAHEYMLSATIHRWCIDCNKIIIKCASSRSTYLKENGGYDNIGKKYRDLGFWFEPKQPFQL